MPIDHTAVYVQSDAYQKGLKIYVEALKPLGYEIGMQFGPEMTGGFTATGFAVDSGIPNYKQSDFWVSETKDVPNAPCHMAFRAKGEYICVIFSGCTANVKMRRPRKRRCVLRGRYQSWGQGQWSPRYSVTLSCQLLRRFLH